MTFRAPRDVCLVGAGRWARVIVSILQKHLPSSTRISIVSAGHARVMEEWMRGRAGFGHVRVFQSFPDDVKSEAAVIVANAARDHERSARDALQRGLPVLVEKPLASTASAVRDLMKNAEAGDGYLASAHVLLFAEYLVRFAAVVDRAGGPTRIRLVWRDAPGEYRYGERKTFDPGVPVVLDVFPHVMSVLRTIMPATGISYGTMRSGSTPGDVILELVAGSVPCTVELTRAAEKRARLIEVETSQGDLALDFSGEPGTIMDRGELYSADPLWETRLGPLALQLRAFLAGATDGNYDKRLQPHLAYEASLLADEILADRAPV